MIEFTDSIKILGIDPGTHNLGIALLELDLRSGQGEVLDAGLITYNKTKDYLKDIYSGNHAFIRIKEMSFELSDRLKKYNPDLMVIEDCFMGKNPKSFAHLSACIYMVNNCIYDFSTEIFVRQIPTRLIKSLVGSDKNKENVGPSLRMIPKLKIEDRYLNISLDTTDAIATAYAGGLYFCLGKNPP